MATNKEPDRTKHDRVATGTEGFDELTGGGLPRSSLIMLTGPPGTGKTILSGRFAYHGASRGEASVYVSFAENRRQFLSNAKKVGMDFEKLEAEGTFLLIDLSAASEEGSTDSLKEILEQVTRFKAKRLVIDSFNALARGFNQLSEARVVLHVILGKILASAECTTIVTTEMPILSPSSGMVIMEESVVDGIIVLGYLSLENGAIERRTIRIAKLRGTAIRLNPSTYVIDDRGITIFPFTQSRLPRPLKDERLATNIRGLDELVGGGLLRRSANALTGDAGTGKTNFGLELAFNVAKNQGEKTLFLSYEEPREQIEIILKNLNLGGSDGLENGGLLNTASISAEDMTPDAHLLNLRDLIARIKPVLVVVDGVTALEAICASRREFYLFMKKTVQLIKEGDATALYCIDTHRVITELNFTTGLSTLWDTIMMVERVQVDKQLTRLFTIPKMRGTAQSHLVHGFKIGPSGIIIESDRGTPPPPVSRAPRRPGSGAGKEDGTKRRTKRRSGR